MCERAYRKVAEQWNDVASQLQTLNDQFGLNLEVGLHSITLYGMKVGKLSGVLLAEVEVDRTLLKSGMKEASGYQASKHGRHTLHSWADEHGPMTGVFYTTTLLVFGRTVEDVAAALDVLDGKSPSLSGQNSPLAAKAPAGALLVARSVNLAKADLPWKSPLISQSESLCIALGLKGDDLFFEGQLVATSAERRAAAEGRVPGGPRHGAVAARLDRRGLRSCWTPRRSRSTARRSASNGARRIGDVWTQAEKAYETWQQAAQR